MERVASPLDVLGVGVVTKVAGHEARASWRGVSSPLSVAGVGDTRKEKKSELHTKECAQKVVG